MPTSSIKSPLPYSNRVWGREQVRNGKLHRALSAAPGIGSNPGKKRSRVPTASTLPEHLKNYVPARADYDAGWWLNNAILHKMGLRQLKADGCFWIAGDPSEPGWTYCGKKRVHGRVYCDAHAQASYTKAPAPPPKKDKYDGF